MPLIQCANCSQEIWSEAGTCTGCGRVLHPRTKSSTGKYAAVAALLAALVIAWGLRPDGRQRVPGTKGASTIEYQTDSELIAELAARYPESTEEIERATSEACEMLASNHIYETRGAILKAMTRVPPRPPSYPLVVAAYVVMRRRGMTHDSAIASML